MSAQPAATIRPDNAPRPTRWRGALVTAALLLAASGAPLAHAQQADGEGPESRSVERTTAVFNAEHGVRMTTPEGWIAGRPPRGAIAMFRAAGEPSCQLEVRASAGVSADQKERYFSAFHNHLLRNGFTRMETRAQTRGPQAGQEIEYEVLSGGEKYRMVVFEMHRENTAWLVVGFFPEARRETHMRAYDALIRSFAFEAAR